MVFWNRDERLAQEIASELHPYRGNPIDYDASQRLESVEREVISKGHHLLDSNDRYQAGAAYLVAARTHYTVADTISVSLTDPDAPKDYRPPGYDMRPVVGFLQAGYRQAATHLVTANTILSDVGYRADEDERTSIANAGVVYWPALGSLSRRFVEGAVDALTKVNAYTELSSYAIETSPLLNDAYKQHYMTKLNPDFQEATIYRAKIDAVRMNGSLARYPEQQIPEVLRDMTVAYEGLRKLNLWHTFPELMSPLFKVRTGLVEYRPGQEPFNPGQLKTETIILSPTATQRPQTGQTKSTAPRFDPSQLTSRPMDRPTPAAAQESSTQQPPSKPFDPNALRSTPVTPTAHKASESGTTTQSSPAFDPSKLRRSPVAPAPSERKPFDPNALTSTPLAAEQTTPTETKPVKPEPFDPNKLQSTPVRDDDETPTTG